MTNQEQTTPAQYAAGVARILLGCVFLVSGWEKLSKPAQEFSIVIEAYRLVPPAIALFLARVLPPIEVALAFILLGGFKVRWAALAAGSFFLLFITAIGSTLFRGIPLPSCGCFGEGLKMTPKQALGLDSFLVCLSYLAYWKPGALAPLDRWISRGKPG
jgi:uncharacterized membrane protein YphA (DoxX/SURF4 family)